MKKNKLNYEGLMIVSFCSFVLAICSLMLILIGLTNISLMFSISYMLIGFLCLAFSFISLEVSKGSK